MAPGGRWTGPGSAPRCASAWKQRSATMMMITELNERSREIFRLIVDAYVETGEPVGSRTLARSNREGLSPATIRSVSATWALVDSSG